MMHSAMVRSDPYAVAGRRRRVTDQAAVVHDGAMVLLSTRDGMSGVCGPATLSSHQAVEYACAILRVADPDTARLLAMALDGHAMDYPDDDAEDRSTITHMQRLVTMLGG